MSTYEICLTNGKILCIQFTLATIFYPLPSPVRISSLEFLPNLSLIRQITGRNYTIAVVMTSSFLAYHDQILSLFVVVVYLL